MKPFILILLMLPFVFTKSTAQTCDAYAGTSTVTYSGGGTNPFIICYGDSVGIVNNGDFILPPGPSPDLVWAIFDCAPTIDPFDTTDPCWQGAWTGENFQLENDEGGVVPFLGGVNTFWIAPLTVDNNFFGGFNVDSNADTCYDMNLNELYQITYLFEIEFAAVVDDCAGEVTINISGGYPQDFPGMYTVVNTGAGTLSQSGASGEIVTISGLSNGDSYSIQITDDGNGCSSSYAGGPISLNQDDPSFSYDDFCSDSPTGPSSIAQPGGDFSFNPTPGDGATINPTTGIISNGVSGTTYTVEYTTIGPCPQSSTVNVTVLPSPPAPSISPTSVSVCQGDMASFSPTGTGAGVLTWYDTDPTVGNPSPVGTGSPFTPSINFNAAGTYNFWVTEAPAGGCESPPTQVTLTIEAAPPPPNVSTPPPVCLNEAPPTLTASGTGGTITWYDANPNSGSPAPIGTGSPFMPPTNTNMAGNTTYWVTESSPLGCESFASSVTVTVNTPPTAPNTDEMVDICVNDPAPTLSASGAGGVFNWYDADPFGGGVTPVWNGNTYNTSISTAAPGTFNFWVSESDLDGCEGPATMITITINALPTLNSAEAICAPSLLTYSVNIVINDADNITVSEGSITNNGGGSFTIDGIDVNNNLTVSAVNTATGCTDDIIVEAPECTCPTIDPPVSNGNVQICDGDPLPTLSVSVNPGETVDWYDAPMGGNLLALGSTSFTPPAPGTYYAETVQIVSGCISLSRTAVSVTVAPLPALIDQVIYCSADLATYTIEIIVSNADNISASEGNVVNDGGGLFVISNININNNISVLATNTSTGCFTSFDFDAPECDCPDIDAPVSDGDLAICEGDPIPELSVSVTSGFTVDWYDAAMDGTLLLASSTTYTPAAPGTYYAEAREISSGCVSDMRTVVMLTVNPVPVLTDTTTSCAADLLTYSVTITVIDADDIMASEGSVVDNGSGSYTIADIDINNDVTITATNTSTTCEATFIIAAPDCNCPDLNEPVSDGDAAICDGDPIPDLSVSVGPGETVDWYNAATGGTLLLADSTVFTPTGAGTFYAETREINSGCVSDMRTAVTLTIDPLPTLIDASTSCAADLLTYSVTITLSDADNISVSEGNVVDNGGGSYTISDVDINNDLMITADNSATSCTEDFTILVPDCNCPGIDVPVSAGDVQICEGEVIPPLSVTVGAGETVDWFDAATAGNLILADSPVYTPTDAGTFYAETREISSGCTSLTRTPVTLTINPLPALSDSQPLCAADLLTYSVTVIFTDADTILVSEGIITDNGGGSFTVSDIDINNDLLVTAQNTITACEADFTITAPDCTCDVVDPPVSEGDVAICAGDAIPELSVSVGNGETVDWYDAATGGALLLADSPAYTPAAPGTYYAETREVITGCTSDSRTAVSLSVNPLPVLTDSQADCAADLNTYTVTVTFTDADDLSVNDGMITDNGGGSFTISGIDVNTNLSITAENTITGCTDDFMITAPVCDCPTVDAPLSDGDLTICSDEDIPSLSVTVGAGETVNWYDAPVGGILLLSNAVTYQPAMAGTYYAETRVIVNGCLSAARTPVTLAINPDVTLNNAQTACAADLQTYEVTISFNNADTVVPSEGIVTDNGGGSFTITGISVLNDLMITASNSVTACSEDFTVEAPDCPCPFVDDPVSGGNATICEGEMIPELTVTVGAGETADWYDAAAGGTLILADATSYTPTMAGTYYAETRNLTNGCVSETRTPLTLTINALPGIAVANATDPGCGIDNGSITLEPAGGQEPYLYQIDGSGFVITNVFDDLAAATYTFVIQDGNGCQGTLDTTLVAPMGVTAVANVSDTLTCVTNSVTMDGNSTISDGIVTYEWIFNGEVISDAVTAEAMEPGIYILTAFQDACTSADTIEVAQDLSPDLLAVLNTENQLDCNVTNALLDGTGSSSGAEISYEWLVDGFPISGADQNTYLADTEGTYILFVTDDHTGCVVSDTLVLVNNENYPVANAGQDGTITCAVTSIFADGSGSQSGDGIVYQWFDPSGMAITGATQDTLTIFAPGVYSLMVQDTTNGCSNTDDMTVSTDLIPPTANAGEQMQLDCNETTLNLNGQGSSVGSPYIYEWTTDDPGTGSILSGAQSLNPLIGGPGNYYLLVTNNDNGCTATDATFVTQVTTIPTNFSVAAEDAGCFGESNGYISVAAQDPGLQILYAFNDQPFSSTTQYSGLTAGSYSIVAEDASGCQWDTSVIIQEGIELQLDLGEDLFIQLGDSVHLQPIINFPEDSIASINWSNRDLLWCPDCLDPQTHLLVNTSSFQLDLVDVDGCAVSDDITIFVDKERRVFVPNAFSPNGDGNNDLLVINSGNDVFNVRSFIILNRWGEMVFERFNFPTNQPTYGWDGNFRGKPMNAGVFVYMAEIEFVDGEVEIYSGDIILMR
jgi:gliding motility-associated-like protein